jgi:hypothetical protein
VLDPAASFGQLNWIRFLVWNTELSDREQRTAAESAVRVGRLDAAALQVTEVQFQLPLCLTQPYFASKFEYSMLSKADLFRLNTQAGSWSFYCL